MNFKNEPKQEVRTVELSRTIATISLDELKSIIADAIRNETGMPPPNDFIIEASIRWDSLEGLKIIWYSGIKLKDPEREDQGQ
jgi:hypothetical protein